jgi:hypothetical protein
MARNRFTNPADGSFYDWQVNHSTESAFGKSRQITESANTANTGLIKQQGDAQPLKMKLQGTIFHKHQHEEFVRFWQLCESQTIIFKDFAGDEYEVLIISYDPVRKRTVRNPRDFANAPLHYWSYELEMEVIRVISGTWAGVTA